MKKINHLDSIRQPIITEKATILSEAQSMKMGVGRERSLET